MALKMAKSRNLIFPLEQEKAINPSDNNNHIHVSTDKTNIQCFFKS